MKKSNVILAFHAHEPLWDLPNELVSLADDPEMQNSVRGDNYILKRVKEQRDIYAHLIETAKFLNAPVALDITNELLVQLNWYTPEVYQTLIAAYKKGIIYPVYTHAHHTHAALLTPDEISDEIRLNIELLHDMMGIPRPVHHGVFPTEDSIDASQLSAY
ncbi:MAG: glycoside hydrolase, partial [Dehalococcoidia bacterium]